MIAQERSGLSRRYLRLATIRSKLRAGWFAPAEESRRIRLDRDKTVRKIALVANLGEIDKNQ